MNRPTDSALFDAGAAGAVSYAAIMDFEYCFGIGRRCSKGHASVSMVMEAAHPSFVRKGGYPAIPLEKYTLEDIDREYTSKKTCAPFCTVSCVHRVAVLDLIRNKPRDTLFRLFPPERPIFNCSCL